MTSHTDVARLGTSGHQTQQTDYRSPLTTRPLIATAKLIKSRTQSERWFMKATPADLETIRHFVVSCVMLYAVEAIRVQRPWSESDTLGHTHTHCSCWANYPSIVALWACRLPVGQTSLGTSMETFLIYDKGLTWEHGEGPGDKTWTVTAVCQCASIICHSHQHRLSF